MGHFQADARFRSDTGYEIKTRRRYSRVYACQSTKGSKYLRCHAKGVHMQREIIEILNTLYGLRDSPGVFWKYLAEKL